MNPWFGIAFVMVTLIAMIHGLSRLEKSARFNSETIRKFLHVVMGLLTLSFPWIFSDVWPVLTLSIISSLFITVLKVSDMSHWRPVICAKGRDSIGEIVFPLAIGLTFLLAGGNKMFFVIPVTILTLADAASALIGQRFGSQKYGTGDGSKSIEGSFAFATVAFAASFFPLTLMGGIGTAEAFNLSVILAIVAMMFEAIAWKGLDNLFIPLGSLIVLKTHMFIGMEELMLRLGFLLIPSLIVLIARRNSTLNGSGVVGSALFCYFSYILGGWQWMVMPVILYLSYRFLLPKRFRQLQSVHSVYGVICVASVGIVWLLIATVSQSEQYIFPYALTFAAHAAIISTAHMRFTSFSKPKVFALLYAVLKGWCLMCIPLICIQPSGQLVAVVFFLAPFCIGIPTALFYAANAKSVKPANRPSRWWKQAAFAAIASLLGMLALVLMQ